MSVYKLEKLQFQRDLSKYQVTITTKPNKAVYEATGTVTADGNAKVEEEISRLNRYNSQPRCIEATHPDLAKFCFCRKMKA